MFKIYNVSEGVRDPSDIVRLFKGLKDLKMVCFYDSDEDEINFPYIDEKVLENKRSSDYAVEEIDPEPDDFSFDYNEFTNEVSSMYLDHKEMGHGLPDVMEKMNMLLHSKGLKLVEIDTKSDFMTAFVTGLDKKSIVDMVDFSLNLNRETGNTSSDFISYEDKQLDTEFTAREAIAHVLRKTQLKDSAINYELLQEFLEDLAPEFEYDIVEKNNKRYVSIKDFSED